jgi:hypothetical protein
VAVLAPAGQIVAWKWSSFVDRRLDVLADTLAASEVEASVQLPVRLHLPDEPWAWSVVERVRRAGGVIEDAPFGSIGAGDIASLIGRNIGEVRIAVRRPRKEGKALLRDRRDLPLSPADLSSAIAAAVEMHNAGRPQSMPFRLCAPEAGREIRDWLLSLNADEPYRR